MAEYIKDRDPNLRRYLQTQAFVDDIKVDVSKITRELVGTREELRRRGVSMDASIANNTATLKRELFRGFGTVQSSIDAASKEASRVATEGFASVVGSLSNLKNEVTSGLEAVSIGIGDLKESFDVFSARYDFVSEKTLELLSESNERLDELIRLTRNPEQVWAWEQYKIATDCMRRKLYEEALEHLHRAIDGYQGRTGHRLEPKFHFDLGRLYRGAGLAVSFADQQKAKTHFLLASRYYGADDPVWQALATFEAAKTAYSQNEQDEALRLCSDAISQHNECAPALFLRARLFAARGESAAALADLRGAFAGDPIFGLLWEEKAEFGSMVEEIRGLLRNMTDERSAKLKEALPHMDRALSLIELTKKSIAKTSLPQGGSGSRLAVEEVRKVARDMEEVARQPTLSTVMASLNNLPSVGSRVETLRREARLLIAEVIANLSKMTSGNKDAYASTATEIASREAVEFETKANGALVLIWIAIWIALNINDWPKEGMNAPFTVIMHAVGFIFFAMVLAGIPAAIILAIKWVRKRSRIDQLTQELLQRDKNANEVQRRSIGELQSIESQLASVAI